MGDDEAVGAVVGGVVLGQDGEIPVPELPFGVLRDRVGGYEAVEPEVDFVTHADSPDFSGAGVASTRWLGRVGLVVHAAKVPSGARR